MVSRFSPTSYFPSLYLSLPVCRMGLVLVSRGEGDTECAEELCRQIVTEPVSLSAAR